MKRLSELHFQSDFVVEECNRCFAPFAINAEHYRVRRNDGKPFWCPACGGSISYVVGERAEQKRAREAEEKCARAQRDADNAKARAHQAEQRAVAVNKQYKRIRERVRAGLCPCCNRNFPALGEHIRHVHPDFGKDDLLRTLRELYGMTQVALAEEIWVSPSQVSAFENGKHVTERAAEKISAWLTAQTKVA